MEFPIPPSIPQNRPETRLAFTAIMTLFLLVTAACQAPPPDTTKVSPTSIPAASQDAVQKDTAYFIDQIADLSRWAHYKPTERAHMRSSSVIDATEDADIFQGKEYKIEGKTWRELLDTNGPGCITRIWISQNTRGRLRFYFDNEPQPRLDLEIHELFNTWYQDVAPRLIFSASETNCGQVSYLPMPFKSHCTIMTDSVTPGLKYQINYLTFAKNENVVSFPSQPDQRLLDALIRTDDFMGTLGCNHHPASDKLEEQAALPPDKPILLANLPGPGAIDYFELQFDKLDVEIANNIALEIYWDGMDIPAVQCNLRQFFCNIDFQNDWYSLLMGHLKDMHLLYCQMFMPFKEKAQIYLTNLNKESVNVALRYHINLESSKVPDDPLYLYVRANQRGLYNGLNYPLLEFEGQGNFVGINVLGYSESAKQRLFFLEGDEYIFVDGERDPCMSGTGMDNYFNGDDRFNKIQYFWCPNYGCLAILDKTSEKENIIQSGCNLFRFSILDHIPFRTSIMKIQEIGCPNQQFANPDEAGKQTLLNWTCFWYGKPSKTPVSRSEHAFYYVISDTDQGAPTPDSPIMFGPTLKLQLPAGKWWIHYAPVTNLNDIKSMIQEVN